MLKPREEAVEDTVKEYLSTGKLPSAVGNRSKLGPLQFVLQCLLTLVLMIVSTIKFHLSKVVPVLAEPKYHVRDKVVLLTGAGGGFGRRLAERLAERGAVVACVDVDSAANQRCVDAATRAAAAATGRPSSKPVAFAFQANLANREETYKVVKDVEEKLGRVDILISGAVCFTTYDIAGFDDDEIDFLIDLNLKSTIWLVRAVLPGMKARNSGHLAVFSSIAAFLPCPGVSLYGACKAGLKGLMNSLYYEFQSQKLNIGVTTVYPYFSQTNSFIRNFTHTRIPDVDPYEIVEGVIQGIESRELNVVLPRWMSGGLGLYGIFPKEALGYLISLADFRLLLPGIMPKATVTVDKWNEIYGAFRGSDGQFITAHDGDEVTPEMLEKSDAIIKTLKEKQEQGENLCEAVDEYTSSVVLQYAQTSKAVNGVNGTSTVGA